MSPIEASLKRRKKIDTITKQLLGRLTINYLHNSILIFCNQYLDILF